VVKRKTVPVPSIEVNPAQISFSVKQCSVLLGLSLWQTRMEIWKGRLKARRVGKAFIVRREDAEAYLASLPNVGTSAADWLAKRSTKVAA
jgi:hypothetical protein